MLAVLAAHAAVLGASAVQRVRAGQLNAHVCANALMHL
jgi:hypothetical protein